MDNITRLEEAIETGLEAADLAVYLAVQRVRQVGRTTLQRALGQPPMEMASSPWEAPLVDPTLYDYDVEVQTDTY